MLSLWLLAKYGTLREVRAEVTRELEEVRAAGSIGSSLQAEVILKAHGDRFTALEALGDDLKFILITSAATVSQVATAEQESVNVAPSAYQKCERCWHYRADVGAVAEHPGLCGRCVSNLFGNGEQRRFA